MPKQIEAYACSYCNYFAKTVAEVDQHEANSHGERMQQIQDIAEMIDEMIDKLILDDIPKHSDDPMTIAKAIIQKYQLTERKAKEK